MVHLWKYRDLVDAVKDVGSALQTCCMEHDSEVSEEGTKLAVSWLVGSLHDSPL